MRKEENTEKDDLYGKLEVHFIENVEPEESSKEKESDSRNLSAEMKGKSALANKEDKLEKKVKEDVENASSKSSVQKEESGSVHTVRSDAEDDEKEPKGRRKHRHTKVEGQKAEAVEESFYKVTGEAEERKSHPVRNAILGLLVLILVAGAVVSYPIGKEYFQEKSVAGKNIEVTIKKGSTSRDVSEILKKKGVIHYEAAFLLKLYFSDYKGKLRYGTFDLNDGMSLSKVIKELATQDGQKENKFTIPEGYTIEMTASKLEKEGIMSAQEFLTAVTNAAATSKYKDVLPDKKKVFYQLQGYIYPDTYYLSKDITGDQLVAKILAEFDKKFDATRQEKAKKLGMSVEEVLIRASLLQKETELPEEYPIIAGVIQNRLDKKMKLQFDSTAVYAITKGQYGIARVMYKDLKIDSPYNTYKYKGLPVGPICSPSLEAIDGVLNPQKNDYLYFQMDTVKNDGSNIFSKTYEEHKAASATTEAAAATTTTATTAAKQKTKKK